MNVRQKKLHTFSVIIPAYNEEEYIANSLKFLKKQDYQGEFEIIVVNNASTDNTAAIAKKSGAKVVYENKKGVSAARRKGSLEASGEILAFTDADSKVPLNWLTRLNSIFNSDENIVAAGGFFMFDDVGLTINFLANKIFLPMNNMVLKYLISPHSPFLTGSNMALSKEAYKKSGGFDPKLMYAEDIDMAKKAAMFGKVYFDSKLKVRTSFRRYSGGHKNLIFVLPKSIREMFVTISRFIVIKFSNKIFPAQPAIRENYPSSLEKVSQKNSRMVALTFDDGPYGKPTEKIIDILKAKEAKATFFILGANVKKYPKILERELREGHVIGNHSFSHSRLLFLKTPRNIFEEITRANTEINKVINLRPRLFRPPYGFKSPWMKKILKSRGYSLIPLDIITMDYNAKTKPDKITKYILRKIRSSSIITLHDGRDTKINYSRENIVEALPEIIDGIRKKGYEIVPLDRLIGEKAYF
jgi:peptidoglycan-N-acetylglucosamine deacetylase